MSSIEPIRRPPLWYKDAIIYEVHVRAFADSNRDGIGDFPGLTGRLDYLEQLGVTAIWLLPFYPSPLRDDGYDISNYLDVHPSYGTLEDFKRFLAEAHVRNIHVITELVINHTSDQHPWFQRARRAEPGSPEREFYVWSDTKDRYEDVRIIFSDTETSNWAWDPVAGAYYWHRFFSHQPDLNYDNPQVRQAVYEALDFWLDLGVDGVRLDAVPYLHEREGTNGENLPETHEELKALRSHLDERYGDRMLLAEANQWPEDSVAYFGDGDECHMAFHFPLMPRLYLALERENRLPIIDILEQTPAIPDNAQWAIFLRNHDELTLEMVSEEERDFMYRTYAADRRSRLNLGIRRRLAPLLENDRRRIELLTSLLLALPGTPVLYYGDEIGMGDNVFLPDRDGVRTPMQWSNDRNAGFSDANPQSLYLPVVVDPLFHYETVNVDAQNNNPHSLLWWTRRMIRRRRRHPVFGRGDVRFLEPENPHILAFLRESEDETILVVANLSRHSQYVELDLSEFAGVAPVELLGRVQFPPIGELPYLLTLSPYGFYWFSLRVSEDRSNGPVTVDRPFDSAFAPDQPLPELLARFSAAQVWYQGRHRRQLSAEVYDAIPLADEGGGPVWWIVLLDVEYVSGGAQRYVLPVGMAYGDAVPDLPPEAAIADVTHDGLAGLVFDAVHHPAFRTRLLEGILAGDEILSRAGALMCESAPTMPDAVPGAVSSVTETRQGEAFLRYDNGLTLKLFRSVEPGINPDLELRRFLTERTAFDKLAPVFGSLEYRSQSEFSLGLLEASLDAEGDAWSAFAGLCRDFLVTTEGEAAPETTHAGWSAAGEIPHPYAGGTELAAAIDAANRLALTTAELHAALASQTEEPDLRPVAFNPLYQRSLYQSLRAVVRQELAAIRRLADAAPPELGETLQEMLSAERAILAQLDPIRRLPISGQRTRIHGDFRLDEVLIVGGDFYVPDFSGDHVQAMSERRLKSSPLRDVAEMLRSLDYVSLAAARDVERPGSYGHAGWWYRSVGTAYVGAYLEAGAGSPALPATPEGIDAVLGAYELTKALREVHWELMHRPDFVVIALAGLRRQVGWLPPMPI
ncbi:MAG: maltose alpha-D-glucosyltransferase [Acidimicrobiia bacterium]|nr:maltose alpha-D-glucosyltransferase [Acidimicrobiia bacterium]NNL70549.1 maltose alpha-D-glucosyltransferase [Acidimicrobiia bacterium]